MENLGALPLNATGLPCRRSQK